MFNENGALRWVEIVDFCEGRMNIFMVGLSADVNFEWTLMACECAFGNLFVDGPRQRARSERTELFKGKVL